MTDGIKIASFSFNSAPASWFAGAKNKTRLITINEKEDWYWNCGVPGWLSTSCTDVTGSAMGNFFHSSVFLPIARRLFIVQKPVSSCTLAISRGVRVNSNLIGGTTINEKTG
jgi:hypothetical protein